MKPGWMAVLVKLVTINDFETYYQSSEECISLGGKMETQKSFV